LPHQIYSPREDGSKERDTEPPENKRNLTSGRDPEGELAKRDPPSPLLGSLEAKAWIFIIIINTAITIGHLVVILNLEWDSCLYSFDLASSIHISMMMLLASMCE
jgi:hypothetical protein